MEYNLATELFQSVAPPFGTNDLGPVAQTKLKFKYHLNPEIIAN